PAVEPMTPEQKQMAALQAELDRVKAMLAGTRAVVGPNVPGIPGVPLISNSWLDNLLELDVLPAISEQAGIPIIVDEGVSGLVTLTLDNVPLERALDLVLAGTPYTYKKRDGYYLVGASGLTDNKFPIFSETRRVRLNYITAEAAVGLLSTAFKPYVQAEIPAPEQVRLLGATATSPASYTTRAPSTYTVVVTAPPALMERIIADLKAIDKMPDQVLLKARIVAMSRTDLLNLGIEWGWPTMKLGFFAGDNYGRGNPADDFGGESPWGIQMGYTPDLTFTNALELALNLLTVNGEATIRAEPQVMALVGTQATMRVVNEEYFFLTADVGELGQFFTNSQLETIESGTTLTITPHIVEGDRIVLQISVEVSDSIPAGRATELPIVTRRTADNRVTVQNGGTVALAGLSQEKSSTTHRRTPGLSNIPLIGELFNNTDDITTSREVAVFVTAYILPQSRYDEAASIPRAAPPAPAPQPVYSMPPLELERTIPRVEPRYYPPTGTDIGLPPVTPGFDRFPTDRSRVIAPPDRSIISPPAPSPAPDMRLRRSFQDEISRELTRTRQR
ncbi:MAG: secretin and TonB N-terminal domain-containing protein, partial [Phycisphaerales bacterium]